MLARVKKPAMEVPARLAATPVTTPAAAARCPVVIQGFESCWSSVAAPMRGIGFDSIAGALCTMVACSPEFVVRKVADGRDATAGAGATACVRVTRVAAWPAAAARGALAFKMTGDACRMRDGASPDRRPVVDADSAAALSESGVATRLARAGCERTTSPIAPPVSASSSTTSGDIWVARTTPSANTPAAGQTRRCSTLFPRRLVESSSRTTRACRDERVRVADGSSASSSRRYRATLATPHVGWIRRDR